FARVADVAVDVALQLPKRNKNHCAGQIHAGADRSKGIGPDKIAVIPPWSHDDAARFDAEGREAFRQAHGLADKFVVMYSGNHSPCHPLDTLLAAAGSLAHRKDIVFCFVGGGSEWRKIREN